MIIDTKSGWAMAGGALLIFAVAFVAGYLVMLRTAGDGGVLGGGENRLGPDLVEEKPAAAAENSPAAAKSAGDGSAAPPADPTRERAVVVGADSDNEPAPEEPAGEPVEKSSADERRTFVGASEGGPIRSGNRRDIVETATRSPSRPDSVQASGGGPREGVGSGGESELPGAEGSVDAGANLPGENSIDAGLSVDYPLAGEAGVVLPPDVSLGEDSGVRAGAEVEVGASSDDGFALESNAEVAAARSRSEERDSPATSETPATRRTGAETLYTNAIAGSVSGLIGGMDAPNDSERVEMRWRPVSSSLEAGRLVPRSVVNPRNVGSTTNGMPSLLPAASGDPFPPAVPSSAVETELEELGFDLGFGRDGAIEEP